MKAIVRNEYSSKGVLDLSEMDKLVVARATTMQPYDLILDIGGKGGDRWIGEHCCELFERSCCHRSCARSCAWCWGRRTHRT
jgi:hypothetical protein